MNLRVGEGEMIIPSGLESCVLTLTRHYVSHTRYSVVQVFVCVVTDELLHNGYWFRNSCLSICTLAFNGAQRYRCYLVGLNVILLQ